MLIWRRTLKRNSPRNKWIRYMSVDYSCSDQQLPHQHPRDNWQSYTKYYLTTVDYWKSTAFTTVSHRGVAVKKSGSSHATHACLAQSFLYFVWSCLVCRVYAHPVLWLPERCISVEWLELRKCWLVEKLRFFSPLFSVTFPYPSLFSVGLGFLDRKL